MRKLIVFKHENPLGNCPSYLLFDKIKIEQNNLPSPPRNFSHYTITIDENMPSGVELLSKI